MQTLSAFRKRASPSGTRAARRAGEWLTAIHAEAHAISGIVKSDDSIAASAEAISESADEMHRVIRSMLRDLRPALLDELGLGDSLRGLVSQWKMHHAGIVCALEMEGDFSDLGESINITVYRIVQEALSNISKHAQAGQVRVHLRRMILNEDEADLLLLQLRDNGKGLGSGQIAEGFGLLGMRERAIAAGGRFALSNIPGEGACIDVLLPLNLFTGRKI
jgi:glucose-6-phosphate-specific signal transduction histidine kinase